MRLIPDRLRLADAGLDSSGLAATVDAFNDGLRVAEITVGAERVDLVLKGDPSVSDAAAHAGCWQLSGRHTERARSCRCPPWPMWC